MRHDVTTSSDHTSSQAVTSVSHSDTATQTTEAEGDNHTTANVSATTDDDGDSHHNSDSGKVSSINITYSCILAYVVGTAVDESTMRI